MIVESWNRSFTKYLLEERCFEVLLEENEK